MRTRDRDRMLRRADEAEEKARKDFRRSLRATKATNGMGTIYFIGPLDRDVVKIGWTGGSPYRRLKNIQSGNHTHLELLAAIAGTKEEERRLHDYFSFALYREGTRSEWFLLTIEMRMLLELFKRRPPAEHGPGLGGAGQAQLRVVACASKLRGHGGGGVPTRPPAIEMNLRVPPFPSERQTVEIAGMGRIWPEWSRFRHGEM